MEIMNYSKVSIGNFSKVQMTEKIMKVYLSLLN
jgi:hypothetical protein